MTPGHLSERETKRLYLPTEGFERFGRGVTLGRHVPPLIHISTGVHARSVGLVKC